MGFRNLHYDTYWRGGRSVTAQGYIRVYTGNNKYQLEHRLVMERHIGRKLDRTEQVHHKNHNKTDNRIDNLEIIGIKEHSRIHTTARWSSTKPFREGLGV